MTDDIYDNSHQTKIQAAILDSVSMLTAVYQNKTFFLHTPIYTNASEGVRG